MGQDFFGVGGSESQKTPPSYKQSLMPMPRPLSEGPVWGEPAAACVCERVAHVLCAAPTLTPSTSLAHDIATQTFVTTKTEMSKAHPTSDVENCKSELMSAVLEWP